MPGLCVTIWRSHWRVRTFALDNTFATGARQFLHLKLPLPLAQQTSLLARLVIVAKMAIIRKNSGRFKRPLSLW